METPALRSIFSSSRKFLSSRSPPFFISSRAIADIAGEEESAVYKRHLLSGCLPSFPPKELCVNSCSLIGTVSIPFRPSKSGKIGAYTILQVPDSPKPFGIVVWAWGHLAKVALEFLKPDDIVCVSGSLSSYEKPDLCGNPEIRYSMIARELNYVDLLDGERSTHRDRDCCSSAAHAKSGLGLLNSAEDEKEDKTKDKQRLWQIFFSSPHEWWDKRQTKRHPCGPDFKHKNTGEALWISSKDPSWVARQLELFDQHRSHVDRSGLDSAKDEKEDKTRDRLRLWQIFFSSPHEWWDKRQTKRHPQDPDFKHKNTGEALWISPEDPSWVARQLELFDQHRSHADRSGLDSAEDEKEDKTRDRLRLWQIFFSSPHEWWDNRQTKRHPQGPDFKHKNTGEVLWISPKDPSWVARQLELFDQRRSHVDRSKSQFASRFL